MRRWGCGAAEVTGLGFVCFVIINTRVLLANRADLGFFGSYIIHFMSANRAELFFFIS